MIMLNFLYFHNIILSNYFFIIIIINLSGPIHVEKIFLFHFSISWIFTLSCLRFFFIYIYIHLHHACGPLILLLILLLFLSNRLTKEKRTLSSWEQDFKRNSDMHASGFVECGPFKIEKTKKKIKMIHFINIFY